MSFLFLFLCLASVSSFSVSLHSFGSRVHFSRTAGLKTSRRTSEGKPGNISSMKSDPVSPQFLQKIVHTYPSYTVQTRRLVHKVRIKEEVSEPSKWSVAVVLSYSSCFHFSVNFNLLFLTSFVFTDSGERLKAAHSSRKLSGTILDISRAVTCVQQAWKKNEWRRISFSTTRRSLEGVKTLNSGSFIALFCTQTVVPLKTPLTSTNWQIRPIFNGLSWQLVHFLHARRFRM